MEANLIQKRDNVFAVTEEYEIESRLLEDMRRRVPATQLKWNQKAKELSELGEVFTATLKQVARGEKEEVELTAIRVKMDALKMEIQNLQDLSDILKRTEIESVVKVAKLGEKVRGASHSLWFSVSEYEAGKIKEIDASPIIKAWGAYLLSGAPGNFGFFLESRFNGFQIDLTKITTNLQKEYLFITTQKEGGK